MNKNEIALLELKQCPRCKCRNTRFRTDKSKVCMGCGYDSREAYEE